MEKRGDEDPSLAQSPYLQGLAVILESKTGAIRAMVGGRDYQDNKYNRAIQATRQPGSTFKPFVYSAAIRAGYPLSTIMVDDPISVQLDPNQPPWEPQNYDLKFEGAMTLRQALYTSRNIIAIKLGMELGPQAVIGEATKFGLSAERIPPYPSMYIGSADVVPLEIISAYSAFANLGSRVIPNAIDRVEARDGKILWEPKARTEQVMEPNHAWLMLDVLRDVVRRGTAASSVGAKVNFPVGGKTGTTNDGADVWFVGFTPDLVGGVWMGMDQPQKIKDDAQGGKLAAPAWTTMMREIYERRPIPPEWSRPDSLTFVEIDKSTGYKFTPFCPKDQHAVEWYLPGTEPKEFCPFHNALITPGGQTAIPPKPN
jgi:penicillin-binding protein 1A